jgi:hypothetical protein
VLYKVYPLYCCALIEELAIMTMNDNAYMILMRLLLVVFYIVVIYTLIHFFMKVVIYME